MTVGMIWPSADHCSHILQHLCTLLCDFPCPSAGALLSQGDLWRSSFAVLARQQQLLTRLLNLAALAGGALSSLSFGWSICLLLSQARGISCTPTVDTALTMALLLMYKAASSSAAHEIRRKIRFKELTTRGSACTACRSARWEYIMRDRCGWRSWWGRQSFAFLGWEE
jgi:hypothetical protein